MEARPRGPYTSSWGQTASHPKSNPQAAQGTRSSTEWLFYVCKVPLKKEQVMQFMGQADGLVTAEPITDKHGAPKAYGYVRFSSAAQCALAVEQLTGTEVQPGVTIQMRSSPGPVA
eukprot:EG_transcript_53175